MIGIQKIHIDNKSRWPISDVVREVARLMDTEEKFILSTRRSGCRFLHNDGTKIGIAPVSVYAPEDTLDIMILAGDPPPGKRRK